MSDPFLEVPPRDPALVARTVQWADRVVIVHEGGDSFRVIISRYGQVRGVTVDSAGLNDLGIILLRLKEEFR